MPIFSKQTSQITVLFQDLLANVVDPSQTLWVWVTSLLTRMAADGEIPAMPTPTYGKIMSLADKAASWVTVGSLNWLKMWDTHQTAILRGAMIVSHQIFGRRIFTQIYILDILMETTRHWKEEWPVMRNPEEPMLWQAYGGIREAGRWAQLSAQRFDVFAGMSGMACVTCFATAATSKFLKVQGAICVQPPYVYVQTIAMLVNVRISEKSWRHWRRVGNKLPYAFRPQSFHASHFCLLPPNVACLLRWITLSPLWALEWHWVWLYLWCRPYLPSYFQCSARGIPFFSVLSVAGSVRSCGTSANLRQRPARTWAKSSPRICRICWFSLSWAAGRGLWCGMVAAPMAGLRLGHKKAPIAMELK